MPVKTSLLWGDLIHLSYNMWCDREVPERPEYTSNAAGHCKNKIKYGDRHKPYNGIAINYSEIKAGMKKGKALQYSNEPPHRCSDMSNSGGRICAEKVR